MQINDSSPQRPRRIPQTPDPAVYISTLPAPLNPGTNKIKPLKNVQAKKSGIAQGMHLNRFGDAVLNKGRRIGR